jgi:hypothetical protein
MYFDDKFWLLTIIRHNVETVRVAERSTDSIQLPEQRVCINETVRNYCLCLMQPVICLIYSKTDLICYSMSILCTLFSLETSKQSQALTFPILIPPVLCLNLGRATNHGDFSFKGKFWDSTLNLATAVSFYVLSSSLFIVTETLWRGWCEIYTVNKADESCLGFYILWAGK